MDSPDSPDTPDTLVKKAVRWVKRLSKLMLFGAVILIAILVVGLIPVNNDFRPTEDGIEIFLVSNAVHADIILPVATAEIDWLARFTKTDFLGDVSISSHVALGWGDQGFFLETKTWDDFKLSTAANALLLPSKSCVHVSFTTPDAYQDPVSVKISREQYARMVEFIDSTFELDEQGSYIQIPGEAYSTNDAFFEAKGRYHFFNTCNSWVGRSLKAAGVNTPWLTPLPKTPMLYIQTEQNRASK